MENPHEELEVSPPAMPRITVGRYFNLSAKSVGIILLSGKFIVALQIGAVFKNEQIYTAIIIGIREIYILFEKWLKEPQLVIQNETPVNPL